MSKNNQDINKAFNEAVEVARETTKKLPPDVLLLLYAYYKQALQENDIASLNRIEENDLKSAFKYNAMIQVKGLSTLEAKKEYIKLVAQFIK